MIVYSTSSSKFISYDLQSHFHLLLQLCLLVFLKIDLFLSKINNPMTLQQTIRLIKEPKNKIASELRPLYHINALKFLSGEGKKKAQRKFPTPKCLSFSLQQICTKLPQCMTYYYTCMQCYI